MHDNLFDMICANPGIHQTEILNELVRRGAVSKNTVRNGLAELERKEMIRSYPNGKFLEYTAIKDMSTEELNKALNHNLDKLEEFVRNIRQSLKKYPYDPKTTLNNRLDSFLDQLNSNVMNDIYCRWYDKTSVFRHVCEEIRGMANRKSDNLTSQAKQDLKSVSVHIANQLGSISVNHHQMYEEFHRIKRENRKQAACIMQQMECNTAKMDVLEFDLEEIHDRLKDVVCFGRTDVDLCKISNKMFAKYMKPRINR